MIVERATDLAVGVDTIQRFTPTLAARIREAGFKYVVRYLGVLDIAERDIILDANLALMTVCYSRKAGWIPSQILGVQDGRHMVENCHKAQLPLGMTQWIDFEGPDPHCKPSEAIKYVNECASVLIDSGYKAGLYVGYGIPLSSYQLYWNLKVTGYWHSCSKVQDVQVRGYQLVQQAPGNQHYCGTIVDVNMVHVDGCGETPMWLRGSP